MLNSSSDPIKSALAAARKTVRDAGGRKKNQSSTYYTNAAESGSDLPKSSPWKNESAIINLDDKTGPGTHWVAYKKRDYPRIIVKAKHELILTRLNTDLNAIVQATAEPEETITLIKIEWIIPYVTVADIKKVELLSYIAKDPPIPLSFISWELYEYPMLPNTTKHVWVVKTSTQLEKPHYVILGFQTARKNDATIDASHFDHCYLRDVNLFLNSQCYPYGNMNLDISHNQLALLYDMYRDLRTSYYDKEVEPLLTKKKKFIDIAPLVVIDCSKQNESIKSGPVDVSLEFELSKAFPANTSAYYLISHDRIIEYKPLSAQMRKLT
ncbi:uncharacterized protein [Chelonus insularis]|uniref:uncharacterized protein n=1 Tax=Chelonus insularis TaxID=460826 RepID=UPI001589B51C|nr:uncharacterized protein LOC118070434 [Chelonus insularis]